MPVVQLYHHGFTCGIPGNNRGMAGKRGTVQGWSPAAAKNNVRFLRSVRLTDLDGTGISFTLTLKNCPPSPQDWHSMRRAFIKRMERAGMSRLHWVTEWQRRGVPHLHGVAYFPRPAPDQLDQITNAWLEISARYGSARSAQHNAVVGDALGWLKYLAKHAARGVNHYQRSAANVPAAWQAKTGRVWGHTGTWPTDEATKLELDREGFFRFRRIVQRWRLADARASGDARRVRSAKIMLQDSDRVISEIRGVSEWVPQDLALLMIEVVAANGAKVSS